ETRRTRRRHEIPALSEVPAQRRGVAGGCSGARVHAVFFLLSLRVSAPPREPIRPRRRARRRGERGENMRHFEGGILTSPLLFFLSASPRLRVNQSDQDAARGDAENAEKT